MAEDEQHDVRVNNASFSNDEDTRRKFCQLRERPRTLEQAVETRRRLRGRGGRRRRDGRRGRQ